MKRYGFAKPYSVYLVEQDDGEWVRFEDVEAHAAQVNKSILLVLAERAAAEAKVASLVEALKKTHQYIHGTCTLRALDEAIEKAGL